MRDFQLYLDINKEWVLISTPEQEYNIDFSSYDEKLEEQDNNQYSLSFSTIVKKYQKTINGGGFMKTNPLLPYYFIGAKIHLVLDGSKRIDLIIKDLHPDTKENNSVFNITAQDEVSFLWSRHNLGYSYKTIDRTDINEILMPKNIFSIAEEILADNYLSGSWSVSTNTIDAELGSKFFVLNVENSNPYNALIEACNSINASLIVDYYTHTLDFQSKNPSLFSGYRYFPQRNLVSYKSDLSGEQLTTMLHVSGGTDADGAILTIIPPMPQCLRTFFANDDGTFKKDKLGDDFNWEQFDILLYDNSREEIINNKTKYYLKYPTFSPTFVNINKCFFETSDGEFYDVFSRNPNSLYSITYDNIACLYEGNVSWTEGSEKPASEDERKNVTKSLRFWINPNDKNVFEHSVYDGEFYGISARYYENNNYKYEKYIKVAFNTEDLDDAIKLFKKEQLKQWQDFIILSRNNNYLGQSLLDFSPFYPVMTQQDREDLDDLINVRWRNANIELQYYTQEYYLLMYKISQLRNTFKTYAEIYAADCKALQEAANKGAAIKSKVHDKLGSIDWDTLTKNVQESKNKLEQAIKNSHYIELIKKMGLTDSLLINHLKTEEHNEKYPFYSFFVNEIDMLRKQMQMYEEERISCAIGSASYKSNDTAIYLSNKIDTIKGLITDYNFGSSVERDSNYQYPGAYNLIIELIEKELEKLEESKDDYKVERGIASKYESVQEEITLILKIFYERFGQYIYEQNYDNPDEIDSINLFNQAKIYFADLNRIHSSHSLEILDIGELEQVAIPRLSVGSLIQVYNPDSAAAIPYATILSQIEEQDAIYAFNGDPRAEAKKAQLLEELCNIYTLHHPELLKQEDSEITPAYVYSKLFFDEVYVTGISRVLREPLKDSVSVEQPSQYRKILAKLIQSL